MGFLTRYLTAGAALVAISASAWGWYQGQRADRLTADLMAARSDIARLQAEAKAKERIDHVVDQVQRLDGGAIADWLRARAGRK
jgi:Flp pilus assembly protein TadB